MQNESNQYFWWFRSGKTTMADILQQHFLEDGIGCFVLHGDDYPHRIPKRMMKKGNKFIRKTEKKGWMHTLELRRRLSTTESIRYLRSFMPVLL